MKLTAKKIAEVVNGSVEGNQTVEVDTVAKIEDATSNSLCFLSNKIINVKNCHVVLNFKQNL